MDMTYLLYFFWIFLIALSVINTTGFVRARAKAKAASGTRLFVHPVFFIIIILGIAMVVFAVIAFRNAAIYRQRARKAERIIDTGRVESFRQHMENDKGTEITDPEEYLKTYIKLNTQRAIDAQSRGVSRIILTVYGLARSLSCIWFFADEGLIIAGWKEFEPVIAARREGAVDVFYKAKLANNKKLLTVKSTPINLAMFGRYIELEDEDSEVSVNADGAENGS